MRSQQEAGRLKPCQSPNFQPGCLRPTPTTPKPHFSLPRTVGKWPLPPSHRQKKKKEEEEEREETTTTKKKCSTEQGLGALTETALVQKPVSPLKQLFDSGQVTQTLWS